MYFTFTVHAGFVLLERLVLAIFFNPTFEPDLVLSPSAL